MEKGLQHTRLVATDLDGTFLRNDHSISPANLDMLHRLGTRNIVRVAATGRNLEKVREVIPGEVPFDYIVYSSGAGVYNWKTGQHLLTRNISAGAAQKIMRFFVARKLNFHAFFPAPENHNHWYFRGENTCGEFERYFIYNQAHATSLNENELPVNEICQFLLIIPEDTGRFQSLKAEIENLTGEIRVVRTSSPITRGYIWMEIFHHSVSKGNGVKQVCEWLGIDPQNTFGIGNDYNDLDLLEFTRYSFLTENAPAEIKHFYPAAPSNENDAFACAVLPMVL